jgi:nickel-dependent lactate racemase
MLGQNRENRIRVRIPYNKHEYIVEIPKENLLKVLIPSDLPKIKNLKASVKKVLNNPIGTKSLKNIVESHNPKKVVIIISDLTRNVPDDILVPEIVNELCRGGMSLDDIVVVVATGAHTPPPVESVKEKIKCKIIEDIKIEIHDCDKSEFVFVGKTKLGNEIYVNKTVVDADLKIATGCIAPHIIAGYSGGRKSILPGVSARKTITYNHTKFITNPNVRPGVLDNNPVHEDMEEAAKLVGLDFIVNVIYNSKEQVCGVVAGDPFKAWYEGVKIANKMFKVNLPEPVDILITSPGSSAAGINMYQTLSKAVNPFWPIIKDDGILILVSPCKEGVGDILMEEWINVASSPSDILERVEKEGLKIGPHVFWYTCYNILKRARIFAVTDLPANLVKKMFMEPFDDPNDALDEAFRILGRDVKVAVIPSSVSIIASL